ncbi:MAG: GGDEF domain-containing protein, partial [Candidatus Fermentibacteraceae bacterium]|nr:GGDEF domain-containing protein [Candidatus Fermentibacteraceae bacterium]
VSRRLQAAFRDQDIISRWGGEEFLVLLPETSLRGALKVAEKTRALMADTPVLWNNKSLNITLTFGISEGGSVPIDEAIQMADKALYKGKSNGRNRVESQSSSTLR